MSSVFNLGIDRDKLKKYGLTISGINRAMRASLAAMGREWHAKFLPLHFEESAFARYGYYRRKGMGMDGNSKGYRESYSFRKLMKHGHQRPLVFTGQTLALSRILGMRVTKDRARVILPIGLNRKHSKSRISMRDEVTRINPDESQYLVDLGRRTFREALARPPAGA